MILSCDWVTINGVWIGDWIYCTLTERNYKQLRQSELHTLEITVTTAHIVLSVFTSHCFVAASNGGRSPSCGFPNCSRPQLSAYHFSQLQLSTNLTTTQKSQSYVTTDGQSASMSWCQAPSGTQDNIFITVRQLRVY
jgi:hypothetical protein